MAADLVELDPWARFRLATRARIGLGRSGDALPTAALLEFQQAHALAALCRAHAVPLIINDRADIALAVGADGVHCSYSTPIFFK